MLREYGKTRTTVKSIDFAKGKMTPLLFPSRQEQDRIAPFFYYLDDLIVLHQQEHDKYRELKKGLLQQMFI